MAVAPPIEGHREAPKRRGAGSSCDPMMPWTIVGRARGVACSEPEHRRAPIGPVDFLESDGHRDRRDVVDVLRGGGLDGARAPLYVFLLPRSLPRRERRA